MMTIIITTMFVHVYVAFVYTDAMNLIFLRTQINNNFFSFFFFFLRKDSLKKRRKVEETERKIYTHILVNILRRSINVYVYILLISTYCFNFYLILVLFCRRMHKYILNCTWQKKKTKQIKRFRVCLNEMLY